ncbi:hypothetical protein OHV05_08425 [Kitasatospora sp. NBC_00070]|uniref:hypothetical protein n=1 Tax=Kitasatospora sp. NBC_00070 TaxID=2975962 RepID=UPI003251AEB4
MVQWPAPGGASHTLAVAADTASASAAPSPSPTPSPSPGPTEPLFKVTSEAMFGTLAAMLPAGGGFANFENDRFDGKPMSDHATHLYVEYDDGHGASTVSVSIQPDSRSPPAFGCPDVPTEGDTPRPPGALPASCTTRVLPDGGQLESVVTATGASGLYSFNVHVRRPDGVVLRITAGTGTTSEPITKTRLVPPIGLDRLEAMVTDPHWQLEVPQSTLDTGQALADRTSRIEH